MHGATRKIAEYTVNEPPTASFCVPSNSFIIHYHQIIRLSTSLRWLSDAS